VGADRLWSPSASTADAEAGVTDPTRLPRWAQQEFEVFYRTTAYRMVGLSRMLASGDQWAAEDVMHAAYRRAAERWAPELHHLQQQQRIRWMRTCITYVISEGRHATAMFSKHAPRLHEPDLSRAPDPEASALATLAADAFWKIFKEMPTQEKVISFLVWVEGYSPVEAARLLCKRESTVRGTLKRARDRLIKDVGPQTNFERRYGRDPEGGAAS
jgi:RNA polymerase sigma factor (sigma-70 family)